MEELTLKELWRTDIFSRAVPWSKLIIAGKTRSAGLNLSAREKLCSLLAHSIWLLCLASFAMPSLWRVVGATSAIYFLLNASFYRLLWRQGGAALLLAGAALHFCYHLYASAVFAIILIESFLRRIFMPLQATQPDSHLRTAPSLGDAPGSDKRD